MAKSAVNPDFSLHPLPVISPPKPPFFVDSATLGAKSTFFGVFFSSAREKFSPEISFCAEKISLTRCFCLEFVRISTFADVEKRKEGGFSSNHRRSNIKTRKVLPKHKRKDEKTQGHHEKAEGQDQKASVLHKKTKHKQAREIVFLSLPHSTQKIQADFLSKLPHFSRLPPMFLLKPPRRSQNPFHPTRRTRAYAYIRACALSEFAIFAFTLHLTPQQTVYQSVEGEGKPCIHLHT